MTKPLSDKRQRFVEEYLANPNATQAAIAAGYSAKTAGAQGHELLKIPEIQTAIEAGRAKTAEKLDITAERIVAEMAKLAFSDPRDLMDDYGNLLPPDQWPENAAGAVSAIEVEASGKLKVKLWPKDKGLDQLAKVMGLYEADNRQKGAATHSHVDAARAKLAKKLGVK